MGVISNGAPKFKTAPGVEKSDIQRVSRSSGSALQSGKAMLRMRAVTQTKWRYRAETDRTISQAPKAATAATNATCHNAFATKFSAKLLIDVTALLLFLCPLLCPLLLPRSP